MILSVSQHLVPQLGNNYLSCDPVTLVNGMKESMSVSYKEFNSKSQETSGMLRYLKEDHPPYAYVLLL